MTNADPYAMWDAAYVLGSLSSAERREYEAHLVTCRQCRSAVSEISGMPALLSLLDCETVGDDAPVQDLPPDFGALMAAAAARRHRSWLMFASAAAAVLVIGLATGLAMVWWRSVPAGQPALELTAVTPSSYSATVRLAEHDWGTEIMMSCTYADRPGEPADIDRLVMVAVGDDGTRTRLATWNATAGTTASPHASTSLALDDIAAVQVVDDESGEVLLERALDATAR